MGFFSKLLSVIVCLLLVSCGDVKFSSKENSSQTPTPPPIGPLQSIDETITVSAPTNKLDLLLVIDDSNSMSTDNKKLASRLSTFVDNLQKSSLDWQMCVTVTRALTVKVDGKDTLSWGASVLWESYTPPTGTKPWVLKPNTNVATIFNDTINVIGAGWANTDDERAIKSAWWHLYNGDPAAANNSGCYRADAALSVILISDEDERSVGGDKSAEYYTGEYKPLEKDDQPDTLIKQVKDIFGTQKKFTVNSIIVKPNDSTCMSDQDKQKPESDPSGGAKSHYGVTYASLSQKTGGGIGSICDADYSTNLNVFKDAILDSIGSFPLKCEPVGAVTASVTPTLQFKYEIQGSSITFTPKLPVGSKLKLKYSCPQGL